MTDRAWHRLFPRGDTLVGMIHLHPLPGAPRWGGSMAPVLAAAAADARILEGAGFDALIVENYGDVPFHGQRVPAPTVAALTAAVQAVRNETDLPIGVNVLRNDAEAAIGIAAVTGASFVRVNVHVGAMWTDQGLLEGRAADTLRLRGTLGSDHVAILADVHVKHAFPPVGWSLESAAADSWDRGLADGLLVTGTGTGTETAIEDVRAVRRAAPESPVLVASGVTASSVRACLDIADGVVVGSAAMHGGRAGAGVDLELARALVHAARG